MHKSVNQRVQSANQYAALESSQIFLLQILCNLHCTIDAFVIDKLVSYELCSSDFPAPGPIVMALGANGKFDALHR